MVLCIIKPKKKSRKKPVTPRSKVRAALTMLFLRSRERSAAIKRDKNTCTVCGIKATKAGKDETKWISMEVHHIEGAQKDKIIDMIYEHLICNPDLLTTLCRSCHQQITEKEKNGNP
jgi:5-methylcytosine-specific restriction endonuclease McrA